MSLSLMIVVTSVASLGVARAPSYADGTA